MIQFDFNALLKTMDKADIMTMLEKEVDKAVADKAAKEVEQERYKMAKANVANDNYSIDDLIILEARLNDSSRIAKKKIEVDTEKVKDAHKKPKYAAESKPLIMTPEEFAEFLDASLEDIKSKRSSKKTLDDYFKNSFF